MMINGAAARVRPGRMSLVTAAVVAASLVPHGAGASPPGGSISGQSTDSATHNGIAGAQVQFYDLNGNSDFPFATATADGSGNYAQDLPDGTYGVLTQNTQGYINKIWDDVPCSAVCDVNSITPVVVSGGAITGIDFDLSPGGRIAGTITSSVTGNPIVGAHVYFLDSNGNVPFSTATTDGLGHYTSDGGTDTGSVFVITNNGQGYQDESYDNHKCTLQSCSTADPVSVTLGTTTTGIDFALDPGGRISGTVTDANHLPLANVAVRTGDPTGYNVDEVQTDASGNFITSGLAAGTYYVSTRNSAGLVDYAWNGLVCANDFCDDRQGTPISVTVPNTTGGVNFVLTAGQTISGTVTAASGGAPLAGVFVNLTNSSGASVGGANTDASGNFTTGAVPPGTYYASTFVNAYVTQFYNNVSCPTSCGFAASTPIVVTGAPVTHIDFALLAIGTGTITGTVTDGFDNTLPTGLPVQLFSPGGQLLASAATNNGAYTFSNVAAGSYYVRTNAPAGGIPYINQLYNGVTCVNCSVLTTGGGTLVTVSNGGTTTDIDFTLQRGGVITGTITNATGGAPLANIGAQIINSAGVSLGAFNTNASGVFTSAGLPADTYYVRTANNLGYINQQWQNLTCPQSGCAGTAGTPVVVNAATVSGIDFALTLGGRISGQVTDASNSQGLPFVSVALFSSAGVGLGTLNTDNAGNFTTSGLPPGTYFLRTQTGLIFANNQQLAFVDQLYSGTPCVPFCLNPTVGTPVVVTAGATTSSVNFALSRGGAIAGGVIDTSTDVGLGSVSVQIYTAAGVLAKTAGTNTGGGYTVAGLPPGTYYARTSMPNGVFYQDGLYDGMSCSSGCSVTSGTPITVLSGVISNGVDFALSSGAGGISGTIADARTAAPLPGVSVQIYTSSGVYTKTVTTNLAGTYATAGLAPGTYFARTLQENVPSSHADQLYSGARCSGSCTVTNGTPIVVTAGAMTSGIDFALGNRLFVADVGGDGKTEITVWRPGNGTWYSRDSVSAFNTTSSIQWGAATDVPVAGDYDGDGRMDIAVWRPSTGVWYIKTSSSNYASYIAVQWGLGSLKDVPVPGDYDGDGKTDIAVWRPGNGTWYIKTSSSGYTSSFSVQWGLGSQSDVVVPGDYDGDGKTDIAVWRPGNGTWYLKTSSSGYTSSFSVQWGLGSQNDVVVPGDYDGDGKTDIAVWRPSNGTWYVRTSTTSYASWFAKQWGVGSLGDVPVVGDFDGDGKTDPTVWRKSTGLWYVLTSGSNYTTFLSRPWGLGALSDVPIGSNPVRY
jgi:hypothetical protein